MTWTAPFTAVENSLLTAAQFNVFVRDNLLETEAARATAPPTGSGYIWCGSGPNRIAQREAKQAIVETSQTTSQVEYSDLATLGPSLTMNFHTSMLVMINSKIANSSTFYSSASYEVTGAEFESPAISGREIVKDGGTGIAHRFGAVQLFDLLPADGLYTVKMKYKVSAGTGTFENRRLQVMAL